MTVSTAIRFSLALAVTAAFLMTPRLCLAASNDENAGAPKNLLAETKGEKPAPPAPAEESKAESKPDAAKTSEETAQSEQPPAPTPLGADDYAKLEGMGLLSRTNEGAFARDMWEGMPRTRVTALIKAMPASSPEPAVQKLIHGILLSESDAGLIQNDVPPQSGPDLLSLRLEKMLEGGLYPQALELYGKVDDSLQNADLTRAGVMALLMNGEKSLACVEAQSLDARDINLIKDYCSRSLSNAEGGVASAADGSMKFGAVLQNMLRDASYGFPYTVKGFASLSQQERALIISEGRLRGVNLTPDTIKSVPPRDLLPLLKATDLSQDSRLRLTARAVSFGLLKPQSLAQNFTAAMEPAAGKEFTLPKLESLQPWQKLPYYYYVASNASTPADRWPALRGALAMEREYGAAALAPFAGLLAQEDESMSANPPTPSEIKQAYAAFRSAGQRPGGPWSQQAANSIAKAQKLDEDQARLLLVDLLTAPEKMNNFGGLDKIMSKMPDSMTSNKIFSLIVIENVDKAENSRNNATIIYENELNKAFYSNVSMPSPALWNALREAAERKNLSEVALLSSIILGDRPMEDQYPLVFTDVREALESVGLTRVSDELAINAALGNQG